MAEWGIVMQTNSRPNFFILLGLNPDEHWDEISFKTVMEQKRREWTKTSTGIGTRAIDAKRYLDLYSQILQVMNDSTERENEANEARIERVNMAMGRLEKFEEQLKGAQSKGYLEEEEIKQFAKDFADVLSEGEIRKRITVRVQLPVASSAYKQDQLVPTTAKEIARKLDALQLHTLYELLGKPPSYSRYELKTLASRLYADMVKCSPSPETTLKMELAGLAMKVFDNDDMRAKYDATLHQANINRLMKELEEIVSRTTRKEVHEKLVQDFLDDAAKVGWGRNEALIELRDFALARNWTLYPPAPKAILQQRCGFCFCINDMPRNFCQNCNRELNLDCPNCGQMVVADAIHCGYCGFWVGKRFWLDDSLAQCRRLIAKKNIIESQQLLEELESAWKPAKPDSRLAKIKECRIELDNLMKDQQYTIYKKINHQRDFISVKIFFSYAHEDEALLNQLKSHLRPLQRQGIIDVWYDRDISAGTEWEREISQHLDSSQIILLLVSPDFMDSDYCYSIEMKRAIERHDRGDAIVIPIILRHVLWKGTTLGKLKALPTDGKPVKSWLDPDEAFFNVADSIRELAEKLSTETQKSEFTYKQAFQVTTSSKTQKLMYAEVNLSCQVGKDYMPVTGGSQLAYVLVELKPTEVMAQVRMPLNIAFVLDHSSSMKGANLKNVKDAVKEIIDRLEPTDYISLVIFDRTSQVIITSMPCNDKPGMKAAIDHISETSGTIMSLGMIQGLNELRRWNMPNALTHMILFTDGMTHGDSDRCLQLARDAAASRISIYPLGIGSEWDEGLLDKIGRFSGGMPAKFIQNPTDALDFFENQIYRMAHLLIRNATFILRLPIGVSPRRAAKVLPIISVLGQEVLSDRQVVIQLGDLEKDEAQSVLFELMIDPRPVGRFRIAQAKLDYDVPIMGVIGESTYENISVTYTTDADQAALVNAEVINIAEKANVYRLVMRVLEEYKRTGRVTTRLAPNVKRLLDEETQLALEKINQGLRISQEQIKSISNRTRKITQRLEENPS